MKTITLTGKELKLLESSLLLVSLSGDGRRNEILELVKKITQ